MNIIYKNIDSNIKKIQLCSLNFTVQDSFNLLPFVFKSCSLGSKLINLSYFAELPTAG